SEATPATLDSARAPRSHLRRGQHQRRRGEHGLHRGAGDLVAGSEHSLAVAPVRHLPGALCLLRAYLLLCRSRGWRLRQPGYRPRPPLSIPCRLRAEDAIPAPAGLPEPAAPHRLVQAAGAGEGDGGYPGGGWRARTRSEIEAGSPPGKITGRAAQPALLFFSGCRHHLKSSTSSYDLFLGAGLGDLFALRPPSV